MLSDEELSQPQENRRAKRSAVPQASSSVGPSLSPASAFERPVPASSSPVAQAPSQPKNSRKRRRTGKREQVSSVNTPSASLPSLTSAFPVSDVNHESTMSLLGDTMDDEMGQLQPPTFAKKLITVKKPASHSTDRPSTLRSSLTSSFSVLDAINEVVCPLRNQDGSSCRKRCLGVSSLP
jgi:hypothetical protein